MFRTTSYDARWYLSTCGQYVFSCNMFGAHLYTNGLKFMGKVNYKYYGNIDAVSCDQVSDNVIKVHLFNQRRLVHSMKIHISRDHVPSQVQVEIRCAYITYAVPKTLRDLFQLNTAKIAEVRHKCLLITQLQNVPSDLRKHICYLLCDLFRRDYHSYCEKAT